MSSLERGEGSSQGGEGGLLWVGGIFLRGGGGGLLEKGGWDLLKGGGGSSLGGGRSS